MSITLAAFSPLTPSSLKNKTHINTLTRYPTVSFKPLKLKQQTTHINSWPFVSFRTKKIQTLAKPEVGPTDFTPKPEDEARGDSTMPERFRYLTKEAPEKPFYWPWFIAFGFLVYCWRAVLWEFSNWRKAVLGVFRFMGFVSKLVLAFVFSVAGDGIVSLIRLVESGIYSVRGFYSGLINYAPVKELILIIVLASVVVSVAEAAVPGSVDGQQDLVTAAGVMGYAAVRGYVSEVVFWGVLFGLFVFGRVVRKRDYVAAALPAAAALAAVGEPWVRVVVMVSYGALAVVQHSKMHFDGSEGGETGGAVKKVPFPLLCAALAIGVRAAAKWAGYRHLTWMIV